MYFTHSSVSFFMMIWSAALNDDRLLIGQFRNLGEKFDVRLTSGRPNETALIMIAFSEVIGLARAVLVWRTSSNYGSVLQGFDM
jgi:hypothetical protein